MAWRAGAHIRDVEFFQFHPTALAVEGAPRFLISEAVRGEGAHLIDHTGHRFVADYHPAGELAPRDIVSRAIYRHLQQSHAPHVWLDLRPISRDRLHYRFPKIIAVCRQWGIDVEQQPIPVSPAAHYWMGESSPICRLRPAFPASMPLVKLPVLVSTVPIALLVTPFWNALSFQLNWHICTLSPFPWRCPLLASKPLKLSQ